MSFSKNWTGDPRATTGPDVVGPPTPVVARPPAGVPLWTMGVGIALFGVALFVVLNDRRASLGAPPTSFRTIDDVPSRALPPLYVPPPFEPPPPPTGPAPATTSRPELAPPEPRPLVRPAPAVVYVPRPRAGDDEVERPARTSAGPAVVIDNTERRSASAVNDLAAVAPNVQSASVAGRARAGILSNRATTVPQGTLIHAVLETAFNSTAPGFARALVQRDVRGFDGSNILIPRGSRLIGEYRASAAAGQKRAMILWTRLIRPDGATVQLASPATDPVGQSGVRAEVDTHFFERFGGAILQSTLDLGVSLAARRVPQSVVVALPGGAIQGVAGKGTLATDIPPTLRVAAGRSISVFVARDLDFSNATERP